MALPALLSDDRQRDFLLTWPVESLGASGLQYPLDPAPFDDPADADDCYYEFQLHFARDYIYHTSEVVNPLDPEPQCACGRRLSYSLESDEDPFYAGRVAFTCGTCGAIFDPTGLAASGQDGWTGEAVRLDGPAVYRFAIVIDCGKFFGDRELRFRPELKALIERTLSIATYEIEDFY